MKNIDELRRIAMRIRIHILEMTSAAQSGHPGPSFSIVEMITTIFFHQLRLDSKNTEWNSRNRFVLSKGHAAPALYAALIELGLFGEEYVNKLREINSPFQGHPSALTKGVDATTGSLGIGLSQAVGMALGAKRQNLDSNIYCIIGDGECDEGQIWESALFANHHKLDNLFVFIDHNKDQFEGRVCDVIDMDPFAEKWSAFGWHVEELNGHDFDEIITFFESGSQRKGQPHIGIAHTKKGFGVSFMEDNHAFHSKPLSPQDLKEAIEELRGLSESHS